MKEDLNRVDPIALATSLQHILKATEKFTTSDTDKDGNITYTIKNKTDQLTFAYNEKTKEYGEFNIPQSHKEKVSKLLDTADLWIFADVPLNKTTFKPEAKPIGAGNTDWLNRVNPDHKEIILNEERVAEIGKKYAYILDVKPKATEEKKEQPTLPAEAKKAEAPAKPAEPVLEIKIEGKDNLPLPSFIKSLSGVLQNGDNKVFIHKPETKKLDGGEVEYTLKLGSNNNIQISFAYNEKTQDVSKISAAPDLIPAVEKYLDKAGIKGKNVSINPDMRGIFIDKEGNELFAVAVPTSNGKNGFSAGIIQSAHHKEAVNQELKEAEIK